MKGLRLRLQTPSTTAPAVMPAGITPRVDTIARRPTVGVPNTRVETTHADQTFVIADAGSCHDNNFERAQTLVRCAKEAGADAVKFQHWSGAAALAERRQAHAFLARHERYAMPKAWIPHLASACLGLGIEFMCTTYLPRDIPTIQPYVKRFKVASFEALDDSFLDAHHPYERPVLVSLGMVSGPELLRLLRRRRERPGFFYLHCVSGYPTPVPEVNLSVIRHYMLDGFSDHTGDVRMGADAVLAGAKIVEVHLRLDGTPPENPDYPHSLPPSDLTRYIGNIRAAEVRLGSPVKTVQPSERENRENRENRASRVMP